MWCEPRIQVIFPKWKDYQISAVVIVVDNSHLWGESSNFLPTKCKLSWKLSAKTWLGSCRSPAYVRPITQVCLYLSPTSPCIRFPFWSPIWKQGTFCFQLIWWKHSIWLSDLLIVGKRWSLTSLCRFSIFPPDFTPNSVLTFRSHSDKWNFLGFWEIKILLLIWISVYQ